MKRIIILFLAFWAFNVNASTSKEVSFDKCVDGDTAYFLVDNESTKFRFLGIDTPESVHPTKDEEAYGKSASEYTCELLQNANSIVVEYDDGSDKKDKYNRELVWVWLDGELLQKTLIENGYGQVAYVYGDYKYTKNLCAVQKQAIENNLNIWSDDSYKEGYCKTIDVSNVSTDIIMNLDVEEKNNNEDKVVYIVLAGCVIISLFTGKKISRSKFIKIKKKLS